MADGSTTNLSFTLPEVGFSDDTWGTKLNANWSQLDGYFSGAGGTIAHERGGLEANVSAYSGLLKITGGVTSAVTVTTAGEALLDDADASAQRTTLGLGTIATQAASNVTITGGSISGITDLAVADGGTGASDASSARANLGLVIGTNVQAYDADTLKADTADTLTAAFTDTLDDDGTQSAGTYTPSGAAGTWSKAIVNNGAFTLAPPNTASGSVVYGKVFITNGASAGAITTSGWTQVTGDSFDTTSGNDFECHFTVTDKAGTEYSHLHVVAMQ